MSIKSKQLSILIIGLLLIVFLILLIAIRVRKLIISEALIDYDVVEKN